MKIGIIGCGYVGQAAALYWKQQHQVSATTRSSTKAAHLQEIVNNVYVLEKHSLSSFIKQQDALLISVAPDTSSNYLSTYLHTAQQVVEHGNQQHIVYTSSTSVYGDHEGAWVDENTPILPLYENTQILYETEQVLLEGMSKGLKVCILRLGEIYGPHRTIEDRLRRMQHQSFAGTGAAYTNLIHLTDIVHALDFALQNKLQGIYNLCSDFHMPRKIFYENLCQKEQLTSIQWDAHRTQQHGNKRVSNEKIKKEGFLFTHLSYFNH